MWIAFSSLYLRCYSQWNHRAYGRVYCCELLSVLYICGVIHSVLLWLLRCELVVNCFQFFIFAVLFTVLQNYNPNELVVNCFQFFIFAVLFTVFINLYIFVAKLWIAFSSLYLRCYSQFMKVLLFMRWGCELLSVLYICGVIHSFVLFCVFLPAVVNCFQFFIFAVLFTVSENIKWNRWRLWIAFSSLYLRCYSQFAEKGSEQFFSCELLSVLYICGVIHSRLRCHPWWKKVVNCFQFFIFAVLFTVSADGGDGAVLLWIAFSSLYLRCYSQLKRHPQDRQQRCELLSVLYICGVIHSTIEHMDAFIQLWIAFSSLYLRCYSQFIKKMFFVLIRCELLSVLYICGVIHSWGL